MKRIFIIVLASLVVVIALFSYQSTEFSDKRLHVVFCDVGQGDAIYIRTPGQVDVLVDGGRDSKVLNCLSENMPLWDRKIEMVFATHPDADHIGGLVSVLKSYQVESFHTVRAHKDTKVHAEIKGLISQNKIPYRELVSGDKFTLTDGVVISTLWPNKGFESEDTNDHSLIQLLQYGDFDLLLTGDISYQILNSLDFSGISLEVFKAPHHGSKTGIDSLTFEKIRTSLAVISAGKNNSYHHPHPSVLGFLKKYGVPYKRTDIEGDIEIVTDGKTTKVFN